MTPLFGATRATVTPHYALLTPDGLVKAPLPAWPGVAECIVLISPAIGADFAQLLITLAPEQRGAWFDDSRETLLFVLAGEVQVSADAQRTTLGEGGFAYLPPNHEITVVGSATQSRLLLFQRDYEPLGDLPAPAPAFGNEQAISGAPFLGDEAAILKNLLPDDPAFDMAVNIFTFQPGATLPIVETHVMEHGLLMIQGQGIYRLANDWYPVQAGDAIWMAPFCPQWFVATGKTPARYIYYKDVNRDPLG